MSFAWFLPAIPSIFCITASDKIQSVPVAASCRAIKLGSSSTSSTMASSGHYEATLKGHSDKVNSVAFSPDGQRLASASDDRTVRIWATATGYCEAALDVGKYLRTIRFDETGARLLTDAGTFDLSEPEPEPEPPDTLPASGPLHPPRQHQGYGISADGVWITYQGRNLLWLPSEYRLVTSAIATPTVALGCNTGRVLLFRFTGDAPR